MRRAGGPAVGADLNLVNLAARLQDGQQVVVPARQGRVEPPRRRPTRRSASAPRPRSSSTSSTGSAPTLAERIVEYRQSKGGFGSLDQLAEVEGIGAKRLEALKAALTP